MDMLFCGDDVTLRGMTTLMLTHDFEPIADTLHTHKSMFIWKSSDSKNGSFIKASFLFNEVDASDANNIQLKEKRIFDTNVRNYAYILRDNTKSASSIVSKMIYLRRLKELEGDKSDVWNVLSCFFHKDRPVPQAFDGSNIANVYDAEQEISSLIGNNFCYSVEYPKFWNKPSMLQIYKTSTKGYEKLQLFRCLSDIFGHENSDMTDLVFAKFINETYHAEMDYIMQLNPLEFETIPLHILQRCDIKVMQFEQSLLVGQPSG
jgi:hypothetical protein